MSMKVDMTKPDKWTPQEIYYLTQRGRLPRGFEPSKTQAAGLKKLSMSELDVAAAEAEADGE